MKALRTLGGELAGLFIEDWRLALGIVLWVGAVALASLSGFGAPILRGPVLFAGLAVLLVTLTASAGRR
ncbi:MAG: hypothetical protein ACREQ5_16670 [Candidatus Dormibacteria bacterium]